MERIKSLIAALKPCLPELDTTVLYADLPADSETHTVLDWLYKHLSEQGLMTYEEWSEYNGFIPELKPLADVSIPEEPAEFIFTQIEEIDWSTASTDIADLPYEMPWLEHINFYLKPHGLRLIDLMPFENAYILCVRDNEEFLGRLKSNLEQFGISINERNMLDRQQVLDNIKSLAQ